MDSTKSSPMLVVFLPENQRTRVMRQRGKTICEMLMSKLRHRALHPDHCRIHVGRRRAADDVSLLDASNDHHRKAPIEYIAWDTESSAIVATELTVERDARVPARIRLSHKIVEVRIPLAASTFCDVCRQFLLFDLRCKQCGYRFHKKCAGRVPILCNASLSNVDSGGFRTSASGDVNVSGSVNKPISNDTPPESPNDDAFHPIRASNSAPDVRESDGSGGVVQPMTPAKPADSPAAMSPGASRPPPPPGSRFVWPAKIPPPDHDCAPTTPCSADIVRDWEIRADDVQLQYAIGSGTFGRVWKANWHGAAAVKVLFNAPRCPTDEQREAFRAEVTHLHRCGHDNVIQIMGCILRPYLAIVTQWCDGATLYRHLHVDLASIDSGEQVSIARQLAQGMGYLHERAKIIHRDLKSPNIFLHERKKVKIGDFGLAVADGPWASKEDVEAIRQRLCGSLLWMSPEVITHESYSTASDVYAYGVVLFEMLSGRLPYQGLGLNKEQILFRVGSGRLRPQMCRSDAVGCTYPHDLLQLMYGATTYRRDERPRFSQILERINALPRLARSTSDPDMRRSGTIGEITPISAL